MTTTPELLIAASTLIKLAHRGDYSLARALEKAEYRLMTHPWRMTYELLHITSESHPNEVHITDGELCTCKTTRGTCWHRAAYILISTVQAAGVQIVPELLLPNMDALDQAYEHDGAYDDYGDFLQDIPTPGADWARVQAAANSLYN